jgi:hypothetical protein
MTAAIQREPGEGTVSLNGNNIITITEAGLLLRDNGGSVRLVDFKECNSNWITSRGADLSLFDLFCVGWRNTGSRNVLDVELFTEPKTRFVFDSYVERDNLLLRPMVRARWHTLDLSRTE